MPMEYVPRVGDIFIYSDGTHRLVNTVTPMDEHNRVTVNVGRLTVDIKWPLSLNKNTYAIVQASRDGVIVWEAD